MGLVSLTFSYVGQTKAETFHFYQKVLRGFLRWHRTRAVWLKGVGKRKAHLVIEDRLVDNAFRMFLSGLDDGGYFKAQHENIGTVLYEVREEEIETVGFLSYSGLDLGNSDEMFCPQDNYSKISVRQCRGSDPQSRCYSWDGYRCIYPEMTRVLKAKGVS